MLVNYIISHLIYYIMTLPNNIILNSIFPIAFYSPTSLNKNLAQF